MSSDPATKLAAFIGEVRADDDPLTVAIRAVLARLERAESIAVAATALVEHYETSASTISVEFFELLDALAEEVQRDEQ